MLVQLHVWMLTAPHLPLWKLQEKQTWSLWKKMVPFSSSINELSHQEHKKGISSEVPPGCFAEGKPHISTTTLQRMAMKTKDS